jgi:hypothetical protein
VSADLDNLPSVRLRRAQRRRGRLLQLADTVLELLDPELAESPA